MAEVVDDFLATAVREHWVVIMAGGLGSRLEELTRDTPKPMLKVGSRPLLQTIVRGYADYGFRHFYFAVPPTTVARSAITSRAEASALARLLCMNDRHIQGSGITDSGRYHHHVGIVYHEKYVLSIESVTHTPGQTVAISVSA